MLIIGCDYHPSFQQIAFVNTDTGELSERRLAHREQAAQFLPGTEATPSRHAEWAKDRQSSDGAEAGSASVLDVASGLRLRPMPKLGSHAGEPGNPDGVQSNTDVMIGHPAPSK